MPAPGSRLTLLLWGLSIASPASAQPSAPANPWWRSYETAPFVKAPDGRKLRVFCMGEGRPTVVLESGLGDGAWSWRMVQPEIAETTRVCSYDRAGFGLSDEAHGPRDVDALASDLAVVVNSVRQRRRVILVGHSLGGPITRQYAYVHLERVAGLVQVDPSPDHGNERFEAIDPQYRQRMTQAYQPLRRCLELTEKGPIPEETPEHLTCVGAPPPDMPPDLVHFHDAYGQSPVHYREIFAELGPFVSGEDSRRADARRRPLGSIPIVVLTAGEVGRPPSTSAAMQASMATTLFQAHEEIAGLSTRGRHRLIAGAHHYIQYDRPKAVIEAVSDVLSDVRGR